MKNNDFWQILCLQGPWYFSIILDTWKVAMRALGFEPKKEEIQKMIADVDDDGEFEPWGVFLNGV